MTLLCALAGFLGPFCNLAFAQINSTSPVLGIDVYAGNGTMNWSQIAATGIQFAEVKATQGTGYQDAQLANNESGATANGIYVGAYDFADPSTVTPSAEASYFVSYAQQYGSFNTGKLLPMLDMENDTGSIDGASSLNAWINAWQADVFSLTGLHPTLYVNPNYINTYGLTPSGTGMSSLWLADWDWANPTRPPSNSQMAGRSPPSGSWSPWSTWTFWQYSDYGSVNGDPDSAVDVDGFNGTLSQLVANDVIPALTWSGNSNGTWDNATTGLGSGTKNWIYGTSGTTQSLYYDGRAAVFQDANLAGSGNVTHSTISISSVVTPQSMTFTANSVNYSFIGAAIAGTGGLTLNGTASVTLNNATSASPNTFSGAIAINKGQLILDQGWSAGNSSGATVASGGAIVLNNSGGSAVTFGNFASGGGTIPLTLAGAGLTSSPKGALESASGNNTYSGAITLTANSTIESASTSSGDGLTLTGGIATGGHTLTFAGPGTTTLTGVTTGGGTVQINSGTLVVTNPSAPFGTAGVSLNGGTLSLAAPATIGMHIAADQAANDGGMTGEQPEQISSSSMAGVVQVNNWNNFIITRFHNGEGYSSTNPPPAQTVATSATPFTLNDATGAATTAQVTAWSGYNTFSVYNATESVPNAQLVNGFLGSGASHPATFTFANIPYATGYTAYVYFNNNNATAQDAIISATSGSYTSSSYYVATEGQVAPTTLPFFTNGSSSTTAGTYTSSNYVAIPIPALGTQGTSNSLTVSLSNPVGGGTTPGLADIEIVANDGATFTNAVTVSANSTIDVTGVDSATMGTLTIGAKTLSVTGGSTGTNSPYMLTLGNTSLTGTATFNVANNSSGSGAQGTLQLGTIAGNNNSFGFNTSGAGAVLLTADSSAGLKGPVTLGGMTQISMASSSSGSATGSGVLTIANGGSLTVPVGANYTGLGIVSPASTVLNSGGSIAGPAIGGTLNVNSTLSVSGTVTTGTGALNIGGATTVNNGGTINTNAGELSISGALTLSSGAALGVTLPAATGSSTPQIANSAGLSINPNLTINVSQGPGVSLNTIYPLVQYNGSLNDNSNSENGWSISGAPTGETPTILTDTNADILELEFATGQVQNRLTSYDGGNGTRSTVFGTVATFPVAVGSSFAGYESQAINQTTGGTAAANGYGPLLTSDGSGNNLYGEILSGSNSGTYTTSGAASLQMSWRNRTMQETTAREGGNPTAPPLKSVYSALISNVLSLSGMSSSSNEPAQTDPFVLQMNYDAALLKNESSQAQSGAIYLAWLNPNGAGLNSQQWQNAGTGDFGSTGSDVGTLGINFQGSFSAYVADEEALNPNDFPGDPSVSNLTNGELNLLMGAYGVDVGNHDVWAVVNHNSEFAVVPEPSSIALAMLGLTIAVAVGWRRYMLASMR